MGQRNGRWGLLASIIKGSGCSPQPPEGLKSGALEHGRACAGLQTTIEKSKRTEEELVASVTWTTGCPKMVQKQMMDGEANHVALEYGGLTKRTFLLHFSLFITTVAP
jgi:hypothetical protein